MKGFRHSDAMMLSHADPLQLIKDPIVLASRQWKPEYLAAIVHAPNLLMKARTQIATVNPQIVPNRRTSVSQSKIALRRVDLPVFSNPRSVDRPESVKYWRP